MSLNAAADIALTRWGSLAYLAKLGDPTFLCLHGLAGAKEFYCELADESEGIGFLAPDFLGFGASARLPDGTPYTFAAQVEAVTELLEITAPRRLHLIAHSMAAATLVEWAKSGIEFQSVTLLEGNVWHCTSQWSEQITGHDDESYNLYFAKIQKHASLMMRQQLRVPRSQADVAAFAEAYRRTDSRALRETARELYARSLSGEIVSALREVGGSIRYLYSDEYAACVDASRGGLEHVDFIKVEQSGHLMMIDQPEAIRRYAVVASTKQSERGLL